MSEKGSSSCICPVFAKRSQEILLWHRPVVFIIILVAVESVFLVVSGLEFGALPTFFLLASLYFALQIVWVFAGSTIEAIFFQELPAGDPTALNRVRPIEEVQEICCRYSGQLRTVREWLEHYLIDPSVSDHLLFFGAAFVAFVIVTVLGTLWTVFIVVHSILILPGVLTNAKFNEILRGKVVQTEDAPQKITEEATKTSAPIE
jgi:hypothetical protein